MALTLALVCGFAACSSPPTKPPLPTEVVRTATMNITPGIEVLARVALPDGFAPSPDYPPMWLQSGQEVAIIGTRNGQAMVMGYGGSGYRSARVIAEDGGIGASDARMVDFAADPDGMVLALAEVSTEAKRLDVVTRDVISAGAASPVSSFDGEFDSASLAWLGDFTIPLALRSHADALMEAPRDQLGLVRGQAAPAPGASSGLYTITVSGAVTTGYLKLNCKMSHLSWAPNGMVAVGAGDAYAPATIIDRTKETCDRVNAKPPIRVLDWSHDSKAFLYQQLNGPQVTGTYRYDVSSRTERLVALASGAAAFVGNDQVLALGSRDLTTRGVLEKPAGETRAEVAISNPDGSDTELQELGFATTPAMLAQSTMTYARPTDTAAIATFSPTPQGPVRKIVIYSVAPKHAFLIAFGPARGALSMSWSPRGRYLAIADGDVTASALTILMPPH